MVFQPQEAVGVQEVRGVIVPVLHLLLVEAVASVIKVILQGEMSIIQAEEGVWDQP